MGTHILLRPRVGAKALRALAGARNAATISRSEELWEAYVLLNLRGDEDLAKVKRNYHVAAVRWHPDRAGGSKERFQRIKAAYEFIRDERLGRCTAHHEREPAWRRSPRAESRARADHREPRDGWDEQEPPPDYAQGPATREGRWIWRVALGFIFARVLLLGSMKLAHGDAERDGAAARAKLRAMQARAAAHDAAGTQRA